MDYRHVWLYSSRAPVVDSVSSLQELLQATCGGHKCFQLLVTPANLYVVVPPRKWYAMQRVRRDVGT